MVTDEFTLVKKPSFLESIASYLGTRFLNNIDAVKLPKV